MSTIRWHWLSKWRSGNRGGVTAAIFLCLGLQRAGFSAVRPELPHDPAFLARLEGSGGDFVLFSGDGTHIVTAGGDELRLWDARILKPLARPVSCPGRIVAVKLSNTGSSIMLAGAWEVQLRDLRSCGLRRRFEVVGNVIDADLGSDGSLVAAADEARNVSIWKATTGERLAYWREEGKPCEVQFSPDGKKLLVISDNLWQHVPRGVVARLIDAETGKDLIPPIVKEYNTPSIRPGAFSPDGAHFALPDHNSYDVFNAHDGKKIADSGKFEALGMDYGNIRRVIFSPDGHKLFTQGGPWNRIWDALSAHPITDELKVYIFSLAFSPDGKWFVAGGFEDAAGIWYAEHGTRVGGFGKSFVNCVAFSPDGRRAAVGYSLDKRKAEDGYTDVWRFQTGQ